jgi:hypothetical protein
MTAKDKKDRYRRAGDAVADLLAAMGVEEPGALQGMKSEVSGVRRSRKRRVTARRSMPAIAKKKGSPWRILAFIIPTVVTAGILGGLLLFSGKKGKEKEGEKPPKDVSSQPSEPDPATQEKRMYEKAAHGSAKDCAAYLKRFPESPRAAEIRERLAKMEEKERRAQVVKTLESMVQGEELGRKFEVPAGTYAIEGVITISERGKLVLRPGVTLRFLAGAGINCKGTLLVEGKEGNPVILQPENPDRGWLGIWFLGPTSSPSRLSYGQLSGGRGRGLSHPMFRGQFRSLGTGTFGGLAFISPGSAPIFDHCTFRDGKVARWGGAVYVCNGKPRFEDCDFLRNDAQAGGAVYCSSQDDTVFQGCRFEDNTAGDCAGVFCCQSGAQFEKCTFLRNVANQSGGGLGLIRGFHNVLKCRFEENQARFGGGILSSLSRTTIVDCVILNNTAREHGGGIHIPEASPPTRLENTEIRGNKPDDVKRGN